MGKTGNYRLDELEDATLFIEIYLIGVVSCINWKNTEYRNQNFVKLSDKKTSNMNINSENSFQILINTFRMVLLTPEF
jgi:hypothetical protein